MNDEIRAAISEQLDRLTRIDEGCCTPSESAALANAILEIARYFDSAEKATPNYIPVTEFAATTVQHEKATCHNDCRMSGSICEAFQWQTRDLGHNPFMSYDRETDEILIDENMLLRAIMIANPAQAPRKIRVLPHEEFWAGRNGKG